tara:strand:- start:6403 stop:6648 length:246 start_codon:yes stop_codon:yes gene_type:complete
MDPVKIIMAQTIYSEDEATKLLQDNNGDYMKVLKNFITDNNKKKIEEKEKPYHQKKIDIIRETLDNANLRYRKKKEQELLN